MSFLFPTDTLDIKKRYRSGTMTPKFKHAYLDQHFDFPVKLTLISM